MITLGKQPLSIALGLLLWMFGSITSYAATSLNGVSLHTELQQEQFMAGLYLTTPSESAKQILVINEEKELQVRVLTDRIKSRKFKRMWIEGMAINASNKELSEQSANMANFSNMLKITLIRGDIFALRRLSNEVLVEINGVTIGIIPDPTFFDLLLRTWIGPVPLSSEFRDGLLSAGSLNPDLAGRFQSTQPSNTRIAAVTLGVQQLLEKSGGTTIASAPVEKPKSAPKKPAPKVVAPKIVTPKIVAPKVVVPKVVAPKPKPKPKPKPAPKPVPELAKIDPPKPNTIDESIFDIDEEEIVYTAESLLSQQLYISKLKKWSQRFIKYPARAYKRGQQGAVRLGVTIDRYGKLKRVEITAQAKYSSLNKEAKSAVERAEPFPRMPHDVPGDEFSFSIPVMFKIVDQ